MVTVMSIVDALREGSPVMRLAELFTHSGHQLYLVGGPVRDAALRAPSGDLDFATDAEPDETAALVTPVAAHVWTQGARYGTVGAEIDGQRVEITTFRTEKYQPASRHPDVKFAADIETDLMRRDFTVNAMAIRLPDQERVDPYGGLDDLKAGLLRTPQDPHDSFSDDPLRMLRAFRFMSQLDFSLDQAAFDAIVTLRESIKGISAERIRDELVKLLVGKDPARALDQADASGLTDLFLPELGALKLEQDPVHKHKDVFHHTLTVIERTAPEPALRLAAMLHDIGKPRTRRIGEEGVTFHNHQVVGAKMARKRMRELRFSNEIIDEVYELIYLHHRFHTYQEGWTDSAVRRYVRDAGPRLARLNALVRADCTTRNPARARTLAARMDELEARIVELREQEELDSLRPALDGHEIMKHLGLEPGPLIGEAWNFLLELRIEEGEMSKAEAEARLDGWAASKGLR